MAALGEDIRDAVLAVLPGLPKEKLLSLLKKLTSIGVESQSDLQFVKEEDLPNDITPIQCRKLLSAWHIEDHTGFVTLTPVETTGMPLHNSTVDSSFLSSSSSNVQSLTRTKCSSAVVDLSDWPENFKVPWDRMPSGIKTAVAEERRPSAKDRREMIRIIVNEMRLAELNPSKSQCLTVAKMIVKEHPGSFADVLRDGTRIGSGYGSVLTQLKTRIEHLNRGCHFSRLRNQKRVSNSLERDMTRGPADQYGCVRWQPDFPPGESEESLKEKQKELQDLYSNEGPSGSERGYTNELMKTTYCLQRKSINTCPAPSIAELKNDWPYLFTPKELYTHFKFLTDISILDKMEQAIQEKGKLIIQFFNHKQAGTDAGEIQRILMMFDDNDTASFAPCVILLLITHFREKTDALILQVDRLATAADVERTVSLPGTPRLIVLGDDLTGAQWMLSIEGQVVVPPHPNFVAGIAALFASYYNFNLLYQEQASCTLEFIQRCFIGINPTIGKKGGKVSAKKSNTVNPHVCTLLKCLMDFEWLSV
ncbi:hypothetical protein AMEX_G547 [Astyanax mexicanus]|uniref:Uncharacterized protein n=2 Tax=Astyanax mexicanus TaxID=7994 RepID=A0A8T2LVT6_ASTMX|nr:hypothetical protein AMEX_G12619 [Astyanax mexicanus]KAG9281965.1 hypothetical protein AMEX_G547 [Astyanax mexicanus]